MAAFQQTKSGHVMQMDTQALRIMCQRRNAIPHEFFVDVMKGAIKCYDCEGSGLLRYRLSKKRQKACECGGETAHCWMCEGKGTQLRDERVCVTCHGDGRGRITYETRLSAAKEMAKYIAPQLKQVDHVSSDPSQQIAGIRIISVRAEDITAEIHGGTSPARLMEPHERNSSGD